MSRQQVQAILGRPTRIRKPYSTMDDVDLFLEAKNLDQDLLAVIFASMN